ncbi:MAG TPA: hypothetical protein VMF68_09775 [Spirochaetia bacterium]|nr:hypothetical protein [Spirochaetia bacterium]
MRGRMRVALVLCRRQVFESLVSPGFYVLLSLCLAISSALTAGFAASVDSSGFDPGLSPLYRLVSGAVSGTFGASFFSRLFAEGPLPFGLAVSFLPMLAFLSVTSVFRFGHERGAGAVELIVYGPADPTAYLLAAFLKDATLCILSLAALSAAVLAAGAFVHVLPGRLFVLTLAVVALASLAVFAYGALCSTLLSTVTSALALFIGIQLVFALLFVGGFALVSEPVRSVSFVAAAALQWVSPLFYCSLCFRAAEAAQGAELAGACLLLAVLSASLLAVGHLVIRETGVRA